jgi:xylulokinase
MLLAGARVGQLVNVVGTTDVLALCTDKPKPKSGLLTRALGVGKRWVSVGTIGSAGSSLLWARQQLFADWSDQRFFSLVNRLAKEKPVETVTFDPYLAGDRCNVEQRRAAFHGITLATTRQQMLAAIIDALARASAERLKLLASTGTRMDRNVLISGGGGGALAQIMHRDWPGKWNFRVEIEATLRGLGELATAPLPYSAGRHS